MALSSAKGFFLFSGSVLRKSRQAHRCTPFLASQDDATRCLYNSSLVGGGVGG